MAIKLSLPHVADQLNPEIEIRPVYIEERLEALPYATPTRLLEQTLASISELNGQPIKASQRLKILDLHIKPYAFALKFRHTQEAAQNSTVLQRQRDVSKGLRLLSTAFALGYKRILADLLEGQSSFGNKRELRAALQRASLFCSLSLLHNYDEYRPPQKQLWQEVIALYNFSEKKNLHTACIPVPDVQNKLYEASTADIFKRLCITSLVDPYHLAYGELWRVYEAFGAYAHEVVITKVIPIQRPAGIFVINPSLDQSPLPYAQLKTPPTDRCRLLDVNPILEHLRDHQPTQDPADELPSHVLAAMVRALGLPPKRHTPRESSEGKATVAVGLSTVHHFLRDGGADQLASQAAGEEIEINAYPGNNTPRRYNYRSENWEVTDEGPGGFGLVHKDAPEIPVGAGELIGLNMPQRGDGNFDWTIGVVRWVNIDADNHHQVGIQVISTGAMPISLIVENVTDTITRIPRPALAVPEMNAQRGTTVFASHGMIAKGSQLRIDGDTSISLIEATSLLESTSSYDRFSFKILE